MRPAPTGSGCFGTSTRARRAADRDVPDPYYGGDDGFDAVLAMVERTAATLVTALEHEVAEG